MSMVSSLGPAAIARVLLDASAKSDARSDAPRLEPRLIERMTRDGRGSDYRTRSYYGGGTPRQDRMTKLRPSAHRRCDICQALRLLVVIEKKNVYVGAHFRGAKRDCGP